MLTKKKGNYLLFILAVLIIIPSCSAFVGYAKQNECYDIKAILNTTYVNISTINNPINNSIIIYNEAMTKRGYSFNYTFCNTSNLGVYNFDYFDDKGNTYKDSFEVTYNGKEKPTGIVIVFFMIGFMFIIFSISFLIIYSIGHIINLDFDMFDLSFNLGAYFTLIAFFMLSKIYLGNAEVEDITLLIIKIGAVTNVLVPFIALALNLIINPVLKKKAYEQRPYTIRRNR